MNSPDSLWDSTPDQGVHSSFKQTEAEKIIQLEILVDKFDALRNLLLDDGHRTLDCLSLIHGDILRNRERLLNSVSAELDLAGEELAAEHVLLEVGLLHNVAEPMPAFATTTSSPPNCTRFVNAGTSICSMRSPGSWLNRGMIVVPA